jgi:hypothetical protein
MKKFKCIQDTWLDQPDGYSESLLLGDNGESSCTLIFKKGEEYEIFPSFTRDINTLEYVDVFAVGEDGKKHLIFNHECHMRTTDFPRKIFDFSPAPEKGHKIAPANIKRPCRKCG